MRIETVLAGRFFIEALAGEGGMGRVYRAIDRASGETVALKVVQHCSDAPSLARFQHEISLLSAIFHPRVVRYVAHGKLDDGPWLAMEWIEGESLAARLARGALPLSEAIAVVRAAAEGLAAAHAAGVVHRDVKPSNLLLRDRRPDRAVLIDFGIARADTATERRLTRTGALVGTPGYVAPEQAKPGSTLDARADVFALGCVLFECVTGQPAFRGDNILAVLAKILLEQPPRAGELTPGLAPAFDALIARMMAKEPDERPRDARAVLEELGARAADREGPRSASAPRAAITMGEQRVLSVILASNVAASVATQTSTGDAEDEGDAHAPIRATAARFGASVDRLGVDGLAVTLPMRDEATDHAAAAARCALALHAALPDAALSVATGRGTTRGRVPAGDAIDRAARRLASAAALGAIALDEVTAGLLDARFEVAVENGGLCLTGERAAVAPARAVIMGRPSPFVGRDREIAALEAYYDEAVEEPRARAVLVIGAAGAGKSRLVSELRARLDAREPKPEIWIARGDPLRAGSPFGLIGSAIRSTAGVLDGEPLDARRIKLRARMSRRFSGDDLQRVTELIGELAGIPFPDEASPRLRAARRAARAMADQMTAAFGDLVAAECAAGPLAIVLEDLHWGDSATAKLFDAILKRLRDAPLFVVAVARPEVEQLFPSMWSGAGLQHLRLGDLSRRASEALARAVLAEGTPAAVVSRIVSRAGGNVLYLEELLRTAGSTAQLPDTLLAMVASRLEALDAAERRVLRAASVFGPVFWSGGVTSLLGGDERAAGAREWLDVLVDREVIARRAPSCFPGEDEYAFRHALIRDAAYALLTKEDAVLGHRLAGEWLERSGEADPATLAEHFERGDFRARAATHYRRAAERALAANDLPAARDIARRGIACQSDREIEGALRFIEARALRWLGELGEAQRAFERSIESAARASETWYAAVCELAALLASRGPHERLLAIAAELAAIPGDGEREPARLVAVARTVPALAMIGAKSTAGELLASIASAAERLGAREPYIAGPYFQARAMLALYDGDPHAAYEHSERAAREYELAQDPVGACVQQANAGNLALQVGAYELADTMLARVLDRADSLGLAHVALVVRAARGAALAGRGAVDEARRELDLAVRLGEEQGDQRMGGTASMYLAALDRETSDLAAAERNAERAIELLAIAPPLRARALAMLAGARLALGRIDEAFEAASSARALLDELGSIEEGEAEVRLVWAEVAMARGLATEARATIEASAASLRERAARMGSEVWRASFLSAVAAHARTLELARAWQLP